MQFSDSWRPYRHVISLGFFCSVAKELQRFGLRDASYPFDWVICDLGGVLRLIEFDFEGFLSLENLSRDPMYDYIVRDQGAGLDLYHDFSAESSIEAQWPTVQLKYERRIRRFQDSIRDRTLFVRYVRDSAELDYLQNHIAQVLNVLRRANQYNDLLIVANDELVCDAEGLQVFGVSPDKDDVVARRFADMSRPLKWRLLTLAYSPARRLRNYVWYRRSRTRGPTDAE